MATPEVADRRYVPRPAVEARWAGIYRDSVDWGAIWGGLLAALGIFVLLSALAAAVGITAADAGATGENAGRIAGVVSAVIALVSFFAGGFIAARGGAVLGHPGGALNGFLVWALGLVMVLVFAAFGLAQVFGAFGNLFNVYRQLAAANVDPSAVPTLQSTAWIGFISLALAATAATLGGWLGALDEPAIDEPAAGEG